METAGELYREYDAKSSAISEKYEAMREETVNSDLDSALFPVIFQGARETTKIAITMLEIHYAAELLAASFGPSLSALMNKISKFIKPKRLYQVVADCGGFGVNAIFEEEIAEEIVAEIAGVIAVEDSILATLLAADATGRARELLGGDENHNSLKDDANSAKNAGNADECPNAGKKYYGKLVKVSKPDPAADALEKRIGGESRVMFSGDPDGREFDVVSDEYIGQAKPALQKLDESLRRQMKATFEAAKETGRKVYYQFEGMPGQEVINYMNIANAMVSRS